MLRPQLPLNALRAFEAAARHQNFTRAALELCVSQAALSHQIRGLEERLGAVLFHRLPRGVALTDEGARLYPVLNEAFDRIAVSLDRFVGGHFREVLGLGVVGTFATGWLLPRLADFTHAYPHIDLRIMTNNNRVDLAGEGLDLAIRFGDGAWHGTHAEAVLDAPLTPLCTPAIAARLGGDPAALARETLLRSYRAEDWPGWFAAAGIDGPAIRGPVFDSSRLMVEAAMQGAGVALAPALMFERELQDGRLARPLSIEVMTGDYWLTRLRSRPSSTSMKLFRDWLLDQTGAAS